MTIEIDLVYFILGIMVGGIFINVLYYLIKEWLK